MFAFHFSGKEIGQKDRSWPMQRSLSTEAVVGGSRMSAPAGTLHKNHPVVP